MKKKYLLAIIPALMALSSCAGVKPNEEIKKEPEMVEDTLAHEEIFGASKIGGNLGIRKAVDANPNDSDVLIGYQTKFNANGEGSEDDTISIRFVAAIKATNTTAVWHRSLAKGNATETKTRASGDKPSNKYYTSLTDGGNTITAKTGNFASFEGFVVYSLLNIPYEANKDSFLAAYLTLGGVDTDVLAIKVEKDSTDPTASAHTFTFPSDTEGYFLQGKINGTVHSEERLYPSDSPKVGDDNYASYTGVDLDEGDYFGSFFFGTVEGEANPSFLYFSYRSQYYKCAARIDRATNIYGYAAPYVDGKTYNLYISKNNETKNLVYASVDLGYSGDYKLYLKPNSNWTSAGARFALYVFDDDNRDDNKWINLEASASRAGLYVLNVTLEAKYDKFIFCRMNPSESNGWAGNQKWNQTADLDFGEFKNTDPYLAYEITGWDNSGQWVGLGLVC